MQIQIRPATTDDDAVLMELAGRLATFGLPQWRDAATIAACDGGEMVKAVHAADPDAEVFIAELDGNAVGCLHVLVTTDFFGLRHAHLSVIAVSAAAEGTGVGQALMEHAEAWTRHRELPLLTLNVFASNGRARRFYEKAGFEPEFLKYAKPMNDGLL